MTTAWNWLHQPWWTPCDSLPSRGTHECSALPHGPRGRVSPPRLPDVLSTARRLGVALGAADENGLPQSFPVLRDRGARVVGSVGPRRPGGPGRGPRARLAGRRLAAAVRTRGA